MWVGVEGDPRPHGARVHMAGCPSPCDTRHLRTGVRLFLGCDLPPARAFSDAVITLTRLLE